jgi:hypothetical protein
VACIKGETYLKEKENRRRGWPIEKVMLPTIKTDLSDQLQVTWILLPEKQVDNWLGDQNILLDLIVQTEISS